SIDWHGPPAGVHLLKAVATDTNGLTGESKTVLISIKDPNNSVTANDDFYTIIESSPAAAFHVLTNDVSTNTLRISSVVQLNQNLRRAFRGYDGTYISYTPLAHTYGTDRFYYSVTNSLGGSDSAWVTVKIRANPRVQIIQPEDEDRRGTNTPISI